MIVRNFGNGYDVADWTEEVNVIPNEWGTIGRMGIFVEEPVAEAVVLFEEITQNGGLIVDRVRGERNNVSSDYSRRTHSFPVPHFPLDDFIYPKDVAGLRAYGSPSEAEKLDAVRMRKMEKIRRDHAWTLEFARAQALTLGTAYAPRGTISQNWYTEFGLTQQTINFPFSVGATDPQIAVEQVIAAIQDNAGSISMTGMVVLASPEFFSALIAHNAVKTAYTHFTAQNNLLRERQAPGGSNQAYHREFEYAGLRFVEMRDSYNGQRLIPASTAVAIPTGTEYFKTYFAPCERFGFVNTLGEQVYMFEDRRTDGTAISIQTESNFVNGLLKPQLVLKLTMS